ADRRPAPRRLGHDGPVVRRDGEDGREGAPAEGGL
ncbi:MAG: hypothetical protein AVDCRST_MAG19-4513, partial [uncultured Thermomicrobiales bacterium]